MKTWERLMLSRPWRFMKAQSRQGYMHGLIDGIPTSFVLLESYQKRNNKGVVGPVKAP